MAAHSFHDDPASQPLADYFFIAGIESSQVYNDCTANNRPAAPVGATIDENEALQIDDAGRTSPYLQTTTSPRLDDSAKKRFSFASVLSEGRLTSDGNTTSNRSSVTIKASTTITNGAGFTEAEFDQAIRKFARERDSFLEEIQISAGTIPATEANEKQSKIRNRTSRIIDQPPHLAQRSGVGSLRRRLSTRSTLSRQPSNARQPSIRTTKRMSGYNSVIPMPQPLRTAPDMHPLKRRYEPVLLDRYPSKAMIEKCKRRCVFPDYIPMFAFPNDVSVLSSDERPRSTWHGFAMTASDGSRLHAVCVTVWVPLSAQASDELERQCEAWRKLHMSNEEREMASSLGERVALESARLSRLLAELPSLQADSAERDAMVEEILVCQERVELMTNMLRPVRHGAASRIEGLTDGDTGFWTPRVYGVIGRDVERMSFWKEWLRAIIVPTMKGAVLRVPASSPKIGMWQPLERYVVNMLVEAPSPLSSITQIEIAVRDLRLYARGRAPNELPNSRGVDLWPLFRSLSIPEIVTLIEYALSESRIIFTSSHTAMLQLVSTALCSLLYPLQWAGIFIPVLPARLLQAVEAPCPYIVGIEKRYDNIEYPTDDFVLVDLDSGIIESTAAPTYMPRQIRRKLIALLQAAAPHHLRHGVATGPPRYATETFPDNAFNCEDPQVVSSKASESTLTKTAAMHSSAFRDAASGRAAVPIYNAFFQAKQDLQRLKDRRPGARPAAMSISQMSQSSRSSRSNISPPLSPLESQGAASLPVTPTLRNDSAFGIKAVLREKRSGHFDAIGRRSSSNGLRLPQQLFSGHIPTSSSLTLNDSSSKSNYAASMYAPSTMAASTVMPVTAKQHVSDSRTTRWVEGHCMTLSSPEPSAVCNICTERCDEAFLECKGCSVKTHTSCADEVYLVCPTAFRPALVRAAFVRCFASLFYTYRAHLRPANNAQRSSGLLFSFSMDGFTKSVPSEHGAYLSMLQQTQAFNEFVYERESTRPEEPKVRLFDEVIAAKRGRGKKALFSRTARSCTPFIANTSDHIWRSAFVSPQDSSRLPGEYQQIVSRTVARLDPALMKTPRADQGKPRVNLHRTARKPIPSMLGLTINDSDPGNENIDPRAPTIKVAAHDATTTDAVA